LEKLEENTPNDGTRNNIREIVSMNTIIILKEYCLTDISLRQLSTRKFNSIVNY